MALDVLGLELVPNDPTEGVAGPFWVNKLVAKPLEGVLSGEVPVVLLLVLLLLTTSEEAADLDFVAVEEGFREGLAEEDPDETLVILKVIELLEARDGV